MHVQVFDVGGIRLLVVVSRKSSKTFVTEVSLHRIDTSNHYIDPEVKLFLLVQDWVLYIALSQELMMKCYFGQVTELLDKNYSVSTSAF
jgi:hypothetical protein